MSVISVSFGETYRSLVLSHEEHADLVAVLKLTRDFNRRGALFDKPDDALDAKLGRTISLVDAANNHARPITIRKGDART